jgi:membrane-associated phospholipid phosphatase
VLVLRRCADRRTVSLLAGLSAGITVAVVYLRYHYVADAVAGVLVALACWWLSRAVDARGLFAGGIRRADTVPALHR